MAIGKPGSVATVEPALVDFGAMAERNIDKIKAEEEAKKQAKAAEAKAKGERAKEYKKLDPISVTTLDGVDKNFRNHVQGLYNDVNYNFANYVNTGNVESQIAYEKALAEYNQFKESTGSIKDSVLKITDPAFLKDKNPNAAEEIMTKLQALDKNGALKRDENGYTLVRRDDGEYFQLESFVPTLANYIPKDFNYQSFVKSVKENTDPSITSGGNYLYNYTKEDILSPASSKQRDYIKASVAREAFDNEGALYDYAKKKGLKNEFGLTKTYGFTDDEKKEWIDQTYNDIINSFPSKTDNKYSAPKDSDGSGGGKKTFKPTIFSPYKKKDFNASGDGYAWSGDPKASPTLGTFSFVRTQGGKKTQVTANNAILKNLFMDKAGNVVILYDELAGTLSEREVQDELSEFNALLKSNSITQSEYQEKVNTLTTQSTKPKYNSKLVIRPNDDDKLGMIANATGMYDSTSELLDDLRKKARMKNNTGSGKKIDTSKY
jgi:hypothetical protein